MIRRIADWLRRRRLEVQKRRHPKQVEDTTGWTNPNNVLVRDDSYGSTGQAAPPTPAKFGSYFEGNMTFNQNDPNDWRTLHEASTGLVFTKVRQRMPTNGGSFPGGSALAYAYGREKWIDAVDSRITARGGDPRELTYEGTNGTTSKSFPGDEDNTREYVRFSGQACFDMMSLVKMATFQAHSPPFQHIDTVKARSKIGTRVGMNWFNYESMGSTTSWRASGQPKKDMFQRTGQLAAIEGTTLNNYPPKTCQETEQEHHSGPTLQIDLFENLATCHISTRTGGVGSYNWQYNPFLFEFGDQSHRSNCLFHAETDRAAVNYFQKMVDFGFHQSLQGTDPISYAEAMRRTFIEWHDTYGYTDKLDFFLWDQYYSNLTSSRGAATNNFPAAYTYQRYADGWNALFDELHTRWPDSTTAPPFGANGDWRINYTSAARLRLRYLEHFFVNANGNGPADWAYLQSKLEAVRDNQLIAIIGMHQTLSPTRMRAEWITTADGPGVVASTNYGTWTDIWNFCNDNNMVNRIYIQVGRTEEDSYLYWNDYIHDPALAV